MIDEQTYLSPVTNINFIHASFLRCKNLHAFITFTLTHPCTLTHTLTHRHTHTQSGANSALKSPPVENGPFPLQLGPSQNTQS